MTALPGDKTLTEQGFSKPGQGRILLIACGALAREILAVRDANGWTHMDLHCLPAELHLYPDKITDAVIEMVETRGESYERVFVVYADCGTGGQLQAACDLWGSR